MAQGLHHQRHLTFRQGENDVTWADFSNAHKTVGVRSLDHVAFVHIAQAEPPADGGGNAAVFQLQAGRIHGGLIGPHNALELPHQGTLRFVLLRRYVVALGKFGVAAKVVAGVFKLGLVFGKIAQGLIQAGLKGTRVYLRQQVAGIHALALGKVQMQQLTVNPAGHKHVARRQHRAKTVKKMRHILGQGRGHAHWRSIHAHAGAAAPLAQQFPACRHGQQNQNHRHQLASARKYTANRSDLKT